MPLKDTVIEDHPDEMVRRILTLERFRGLPMGVDDESALLDILKVMATRIIAIENKAKP